MTNTKTRAAAVAGGLAMAAAFAVSCSTTTEKSKDIASSASSIGSSAASAASSAASAAGSAASSAASAAGSAASSAGSVASSAVSSVLNGTPTTINAPGVGDVALDGPAAAVYQKAGGAGALGAPTAAPEKIGEGTVYAFAGGTIYQSPKHGPKLVQGEILRLYQKDGGPAGPLGWPTADEAETGGGAKVAGGGWIGEFEHGTITWLNDGAGVFSETVTQK